LPKFYRLLRGEFILGMSIKLQSKVWDECTNVSGSKLLLLLALADFADDQGQCFPKIKTLADRIRTDERGTRKHMKELRELGYIEVLESSGGRRSNTYKVHVNPVKTTLSKQPCQNNHGSNDTPNPVKNDRSPNIYNEPSVEPPKKDTNVSQKIKSKKSTQIPEKDFFDMQYAKDFHMEPDLAFEIFSDWAKAKGQLYKDWNLAWKKACREWLPEKVVQAQANQSRANTASEERTLDPQWYEDWAAFHAGERGDTPPNKEDYYR